MAIEGSCHKCGGWDLGIGSPGYRHDNGAVNEHLISVSAAFLWKLIEIFLGVLDWMPLLASLFEVGLKR
jgi:hypothetical protein